LKIQRAADDVGDWLMFATRLRVFLVTLKGAAGAVMMAWVMNRTGKRSFEAMLNL